MDLAIVIKYLLAGGMSSLGAFVHATVKWKKSRTDEVSFTKIDFFILFIIAYFTGLLFGMIAIVFFPDNINIVLLSFGIGGFLGLEGLNRISQAFLDRLVSEIKEKNDD